ncbi:MAG: hypothetical protein HY303_04170 [Candidatus Wallbacteria bacterium]|nr:hypothetical protein [Candidatus Wallbacteria bacterium]
MKKLILALCVGLASVTCVRAWELIPLERLIADSDLVVIGKLSYVMRGEPGLDAVDHGYIEASEVLKGQVPDGHGLVLVFPGRRGTAGPDGKFHSTLTAGDLRFEEGLDVCWLLKRVPGTDAYAIDHPSRVQPYPFYDDLRARVVKAKQAK